MSQLRFVRCFASVLMLLACGTAQAAELYGLSPGPVALDSAGPMAFGPSGVLFVGDPQAAKIYALNTEDVGDPSSATHEVDDITAKLAEAFDAQEVSVTDMAVNPETGNVFFSVSTGDGAAIAKLAPGGNVSRLNLDKIGHAVAAIPDPPADKVVQQGRRRRNPRSQSITDIAYADGRVLVAGLSSAEAPSTVREFDFPFRGQSHGMQVEIFHAAHGRTEDDAPIQTFVPFNIDGEPNLLAGYTCTPLVKMPIAKIKSDRKIQGTTVAELGNRNRPLDMIVYQRDGKHFVLMANSARGVMKISTEDLARESGLTEPVSGGGTAGQSYETIESLSDVVQLDKLDESRAVVMIQPGDGASTIETIELP